MVDDRRLRYLEAMGIPVWVRRTVASAGASAEPSPEPVPEAAETAASDDGEAPVAALGWDALAARVAACTACPLHETRNRTVFGAGDRSADWLLVGEAPGAEEDRLGEPFVGRAGKLLDAMLAAMALDRHSVYIANILKCRPPKNRDPRPEEVAACSPYLRRQVELIQPKVILALGRVAAHWLLDTGEPLGRLRQRAHTYEDTGVPVVVTYHPAYLLRTPQDKRKAWQDLLRAAAVAARR